MEAAGMKTAAAEAAAEAAAAMETAEATAAMEAAEAATAEGSGFQGKEREGCDQGNA
jgi:hypothetical protein